jgi:hypothetical protein
MMQKAALMLLVMRLRASATTVSVLAADRQAWHEQHNLRHHQGGGQESFRHDIKNLNQAQGTPPFPVS